MAHCQRLFHADLYACAHGRRLFFMPGSANCENKMFKLQQKKRRSRDSHLVTRLVGFVGLKSHPARDFKVSRDLKFVEKFDNVERKTRVKENET